MPIKYEIRDIIEWDRKAIVGWRVDVKASNDAWEKFEFEADCVNDGKKTKVGVWDFRDCRQDEIRTEAVIRAWVKKSKFVEIWPRAKESLGVPFFHCVCLEKEVDGEIGKLKMDFLKFYGSEEGEFEIRPII